MRGGPANIPLARDEREEAVASACGEGGGQGAGEDRLGVVM